DVRRMANVEELPPVPFIDLLAEMGLPTKVDENPKPFVVPQIKSLI
ncbi:MAG: saccharopine dehydrogenase, partial [Negativicutes bacterium]|nr:saccharopine dehydrogenase [Negativicutes bacterium]